MDEEVKYLKTALRIIDCKHVSSYINDNEILIRFTYKNRNYILHINNDYGLVTIEQIESANIGSVGYDEIALLNDIREILPYTEFEGYNVYAISYFNSLGYVGNKPVTIKKMEISIDTGNEDIAVYRAIIKPTKEVEGEFVDYFGGLYEFDSRIFEDDWLEDFNEKVDTYSEEDLFIIISTIASYSYKLLTNSWKGKKIDPFVLSYVSEQAINEAQKYINLYPVNEGEDKFEGWYHMWELYFTDKTLEDYLNKRGGNQKKKEFS